MISVLVGFISVFVLGFTLGYSHGYDDCWKHIIVVVKEREEISETSSEVKDE